MMDEELGSDKDQPLHLALDRSFSYLLRDLSWVLELSFLLLLHQFLSFYLATPLGTLTCPDIYHLTEKKQKP